MTGSSLVASLDRIGQVQSHLSAAVVVLLGIVAVGAVLPGVWLVTHHLTVIAHEAAHASFGSAIGGTVAGMRLLRTAEGATAISGTGTLGNFFNFLVGYLGPSLFGIGAASLIRIGHIVAVLWIALGALLSVMFVLRRSFGILTVVVSFLLLFWLAGFGTVGVQIVTAYGIAWFLLISGLRRILELRGKESGDGDALRKMTKIPHRVWHGFWLAGTAAGLVLGASLLM
jgi:Peptidase M50B-like